MNMNLLAVSTLQSIYFGCSNQKMFWEVNFTPMNIKFCCRRNVRKHRDINNGEQYITLDIYLKFVNMNKINITHSESKYYL